MKGFVRVATITALALPLAGAPLAAQSWRADLGVNGGASWYSPMLGGDQINNSNGNVRFRSGWLTGAQLGFWLTPRIGIRANGTYTDRSLKQGNGFMSQDNTLIQDVNLWSGSGDLLIRFKQPSENFAHEMLPYLALGAGAKWHNPAGDAYTVTDASKSWNGVPIACTTISCTGGSAAGTSNFFLSEERVIMGLAGLGEDVRLAPHMALRLEVGDRFYKPALIAIAPTAGNSFTTTNSDKRVSKWVHEPYVQVGLQMLMGLASPPVVAVVPAPAPPPPPAPEPAPAPVPTTRDVSVCVVDPSSATGLRTVTAQFNPTTNDTTVMMNGQSMAFSRSMGTIPVASGQPWYVQGQPFTIGTGRSQLSYVSFGSARNIDANDLSYVGTVNGLPVYANRSDVSNLTIPNPPTDINGNTTLTTGLRNVQVLYVPLTSTGCNFQPVQIQQQVRKTRQ